jgi:hypothetical protein
MVRGALTTLPKRVSIVVPLHSNRNGAENTFPGQRVSIIVPSHSNMIRNPIFAKM